MTFNYDLYVYRERDNFPSYWGPYAATSYRVSVDPAAWESLPDESRTELDKIGLGPLREVNLSDSMIELLHRLGLVSLGEILYSGRRVTARVGHGLQASAYQMVCWAFEAGSEVEALERARGFIVRRGTPDELLAAHLIRPMRVGAGIEAQWRWMSWSTAWEPLALPLADTRSWFGPPTPPQRRIPA